MFDIVSPLSDLASPLLPYVLVVVLHGPLTEPVTVTVSLRQADGGTVATQQLAAPVPPDRRLRLCLSPHLEPGDYTGEVRIGGHDTVGRFAFHQLPESTPPDIPFGIYAYPVPSDPAKQDAMLSEFRAAGIDTITGHLNELRAADSAFYDRAGRHGLRFRPSMRYWRAEDSREERQKANAPVLLGEREARHGICLSRPDLRQYAAENVVSFLESYRRHPAFAGSVYFGDDLFLPTTLMEGHAFIGCYCDVCREAYRAATSEEPPTATEARVGAVSEDDPWLRWQRHRCDRQYADFLCAIEAAKDRVDPAIVIGPCHGPPDNPFNQLATGLYGPRTQVMGAVSSYAYTFLRSPASDFIVHYELGRMGNRQKPVWMLGFLEGDRTMAPAWHVQQSYWNMLAAGYQTVSFFSWWGLPKLRESDSADVRRRVEEAVAALTRCGQHKEWIFPVAANWQRPEARCAQLYSLTTEAFDLAPQFRHHLHLRRIADFYRLALARQVPLDLIAEEEVLDGILDNYDIVSLHDVRALRGDVLVRLAEFAATPGKQVFVDRDLLYPDGWHPRARVTIRGALELSPAGMVELMAPHAGPRPICANPDATLRRFTAGAIDYLVVANNYPDRVTGMPYNYGDPQVNYDHAALVPNEAIHATVAFPEPGRWLFDAAIGEALGSTDEPLDLDLEPAWGRVIAILPAAEAVLGVSVPETVVAGDAATIRLTLTDDRAQPLAGALTVELTLVTPDGERRSRMTALADGAAAITWRFGLNARPGTWQVEASGGFPRRTVRANLQVTMPREPVWVTAAP